MGNPGHSVPIGASGGVTPNNGGRGESKAGLSPAARNGAVTVPVLHGDDDQSPTALLEDLLAIVETIPTFGFTFFACAPRETPTTGPFGYKGDSSSSSSSRLSDAAAAQSSELCIAVSAELLVL